ncbi:hypothetical protein J1614_002242 [Plenodomus biglobosus]|nr:hypothetical protein J1614_002242 [Plenodomus biglobosus]
MRTPKIHSLNALIDFLNKTKGTTIEKHPVSIESLDSNSWLSGFIEADASFQVRTTLSGKYPKLECKLEISQRREDHKGYDNLHFLRYIAEFLGTEVKKIRSDKPNPEYRVRTNNLKEVTYVGLLTLPYAGTASPYSSKYSILNDTVKKLEQRSKSAGNILTITNGTSETLRNGIVVNSENVRRVSDHVPKHLKPLNNEQLGYYLAGLVDGDGHFSKDQQLVIVFSSPDAFLAYYLKEKLGYGNVKKVKDKNAYLLIISNKEGMLQVINLINGKLRTKHRFDQVVNNVLNHTKYTDQNIHFTLDSRKNLDNH